MVAFQTQSPTTTLRMMNGTNRTSSSLELPEEMMSTLLHMFHYIDVLPCMI
jgi:hypothetical protein